MRPALLAAALATFAAPAAALAQGSDRGGASASSGAASQAGSRPTAVPASPADERISAARRTILRAQAAYVARDFDTALAAFREAVTGQPERVEATLGIAYTLAARGDVDGALSSFQNAARLAQTANEHLNRARALQGAANLLESARRWDDARNAWQEFVTFAEAHADVANAAHGRARLDTLRQRAEAEQRYREVRERIAARQRQNARGPGQQGGGGGP